MDEAAIQSAIERVSRDIEQEPGESRSYRKRAQLHILAGAFHLARMDLDACRHYDIGGGGGPCKPGRLHSDFEINGIGVTYWMEGHLDLAVSHWRYMVELHLLGRVAYSDAGVGIRAGLLLWFGAANRKSRDDLVRIEQHFRKRVASKFSSLIMAGPDGAVARYFLGEIDERQLLAEAEGVRIGNDQYLCKARFAAAVRAREEGRHKDYYRLLEAAGPKDANPYDYYNMWEFYLARHEVSKGATIRRHTRG
jgi:hypothetical protein